MTIRFELLCETIHCFGKHQTTLGIVFTEQEANTWKTEQTALGSKASLPSDDPIRTCPVVRCPFKLQAPRFDYCKLSD